MDLNKEIKLSELFKRKPKDKAEAAVVAEDVAAEPRKPKRERAGGGGFLKRDLSFRRGKRGEGEAKPAKPKREKDPRRSRGKKAADPLPSVPLMRAFNLLPKDDLQAGGRRPSTAQLVLAVVALVAIAALASFFLISSATVADKEREKAQLQEELAAKNVPAEEPSPLPSGGDPQLADEQNRRTAALASALGGRIAWDRVLREFALVLPDDVWLTAMTASAGASADPAAAAQTTLQITGYGRTHEAVAQLLSRAAVIPEFQSVQLVSSTKVELGNEEVYEFSITAVVKPRSGATS
jgi:Tfp pilus assembly protein PilN